MTADPLHGRPALVPELVVSDIVRSLAFYRSLGFEVLFDRPEDGFANLALEGGQLMLEQMGDHWDVGPMEPPFGRGLNLEFAVADAAAMAERIIRHGWPLFQPLRERIYRVGGGTVRVLQVLVQDPDGYLLRFQTDLEV